MKLIDLSQPVYDGCPRCPADPPVQSRLVATHDNENWQVEQLTFTSHTGSHLDAPRHKFAGAPSIDEFPLERFVGEALILDFREFRPGMPFTSSMLNRTLRHARKLKDQIILIATGAGQRRPRNGDWNEPLSFLSPDGAGWLAEQEIRGVGIDHYSIGGTVEPTNRLTHEALLEANIWIVEDLRFPPAVFDLPQPVEFWCLPLHLKKHGGAPCRPVVVVKQPHSNAG